MDRSHKLMMPKKIEKWKRWKRWMVNKRYGELQSDKKQKEQPYRSPVTTISSVLQC